MKKEWKKEMGKKNNVVGLFFLASIIICELFICRFYINGSSLVTSSCISAFMNSYKCIVLVVIAFVIFVTFLYNNSYVNICKNYRLDNIKSLIKNTISGELFGVSFVLFFIIHLSWITNTLLSLINLGSSICEPLVFIAGLGIAILLKPQDIESTDKSIVLLTPISNLNSSEKTGDSFQAFLKPFTNASQKGLHIGKIVVFLSPNISIQTESIEDGKKKDRYCWGGYGIDYQREIVPLENNRERVKYLIGKTVPAESNIEYIDCNYDENISQITKIVSAKVKDLSQYYRDDQLVFHLTPGTKTISIALMICGLKGDRQLTYIEQKNNQYLMLDIDKNIFEELLSEV